jgi:hypothetical protein
MELYVCLEAAYVHFLLPVHVLLPVPFVLTPFDLLLQAIFTLYCLFSITSKEWQN